MIWGASVQNFKDLCLFFLSDWVQIFYGGKEQYRASFDWLATILFSSQLEPPYVVFRIRQFEPMTLYGPIYVQSMLSFDSLEPRRSLSPFWVHCRRRTSMILGIGETISERREIRKRGKREVELEKRETARKFQSLGDRMPGWETEKFQWAGTSIRLVGTLLSSEVEVALLICKIQQEESTDEQPRHTGLNMACGFPSHCYVVVLYCYRGSAVIG